MKNIRQNTQDIPKKSLIKRLRANDSLSKYKKKNQNLLKKQNFESSNHEDLPLQNLKPQLTEISNQNKETNNIFKKYERPDLKSLTKKPSYSSARYNLLRVYTPRRDYI